MANLADIYQTPDEAEKPRLFSFLNRKKKDDRPFVIQSSTFLKFEKRLFTAFQDLSITRDAIEQLERARLAEEEEAAKEREKLAGVPERVAGVPQEPEAKKSPFDFLKGVLEKLLDFLKVLGRLLKIAALAISTTLVRALRLAFKAIKSAGKGLGRGMRGLSKMRIPPVAGRIGMFAGIAALLGGSALSLRKSEPQQQPETTEPPTPVESPPPSAATQQQPEATPSSETPLSPETGAPERQDSKDLGGQPAAGAPVKAASGREAAETYLGRKMTEKEYDYLIRATHAEAGPRSDQNEQAMIMGSILNRARSHPNGVIGALTEKNQFQSVTGTSVAPGPSPHFTNGPSQQRYQSIEQSAINFLPRVSKSQKNFTAASAAAYGPGTNIGYRNKMIEAGGSTYGGTIFQTSMAAPAPDVLSTTILAASGEIPAGGVAAGGQIYVQPIIIQHTLKAA
jgi:hypothetical protein